MDVCSTGTSASPTIRLETPRVQPHLRTTLADAIEAFEKSSKNAILSAIIQEGLTLSTREYNTLRSILCYHFDPETGKTVRNEIQPGVPFPRLESSSKNLKFRRENCPGVVSLICSLEGDLRLLEMKDYDSKSSIEIVGARRKLIEVIFSELEMYFEVFRYPLTPRDDGIYHLSWIRFFDGSSITEEKPFTISSIHLAELERVSWGCETQAVIWKIAKSETDTLTVDMFGVEEGEWAEISDKPIEFMGKTFLMKSVISFDVKAASQAAGNIGPAGKRPLVNSNIPEESFCDLNFRLGDNGTYRYSFNRRIENYYSTRTWVEDNFQARKNMSEATRDRTLREEIDRQGHAQRHFPLTCVDILFEPVHLENNAIGHEFSNWVDMAHERGKLKQFVWELRVAKLQYLAEALQDAYDDWKEDKEKKFTFKTRIMGEQVHLLYGASKKLHDLLSLENETTVQKAQRLSSYFVTVSLRKIFAIVNAMSFKSPKEEESLKEAVKTYRGLKCLFHVLTITPTAATIFFELQENVKLAEEEGGFIAGALSQQAGERINAIHKREFRDRGKYDGLHCYRSLRDDWVFRYVLLRTSPIKKYFPGGNPSHKGHLRVPEGDHCQTCLSPCTTDNCKFCEDPVVREILDSARQRKLTSSLQKEFRADPSRGQGPEILLMDEGDDFF